MAPDHSWLRANLKGIAEWSEVPIDLPLSALTYRWWWRVRSGGDGGGGVDEGCWRLGMMGV